MDIFRFVYFYSIITFISVINSGCFAQSNADIISLIMGQDKSIRGFSPGSSFLEAKQKESANIELADDDYISIRLGESDQIEITFYKDDENRNNISFITAEIETEDDEQFVLELYHSFKKHLDKITSINDYGDYDVENGYFSISVYITPTYKTFELSFETD